MRFIIAAFILLFSACATVGPKITSEEEKRAQAILKAEAQAWQRKQEQRILEVAAQVMRAADNVRPLECLGITGDVAVFER
jgi:starvation-inducible outer membrane lipoprotein